MSYCIMYLTGHHLEVSGECPAHARGLETVRNGDKIKEQDVIRICWNGRQGRREKYSTPWPAPPVTDEKREYLQIITADVK